jgi:hypothetical protein
MRVHPLARHTVDVLTILVLGFVYLVALSAGTLLTAGRRKLASAVTTRKPVNPHGDDPAKQSH